MHKLLFFPNIITEAGFIISFRCVEDLKSSCMFVFNIICNSFQSNCDNAWGIHQVDL